MRRLDRPPLIACSWYPISRPGWRLSELLEESTAADIPIDITVVDRAAAAAAAGGGAVRPPQPRARDRRAGAASADRDAAVAPGHRRARVRSGAREAESRAATSCGASCASPCRRRRDCRAPTSAPTPTPSASSRCRCCSGRVARAGRVSRRSCRRSSRARRNIATVSRRRCRRRSRVAVARAAVRLRTAFQTPSEAQLAFESVLASDRSYVTTSPQLDRMGARSRRHHREQAAATRHGRSPSPPAKRRASCGVTSRRVRRSFSEGGSGFRPRRRGRARAGTGGSRHA